ncbi:MAG TPA: EscU/YscU/HrcU family type III secretion system export apparatus switch protein, partial [Acidiphilium sp.]
MANSGTESRNLPASRKKLEDARKKGQVAKSRDMTGAVVFTLGSIYLVVEAPRFLAGFSKLIHAAGDTSGPFP